MKKIILTGGGTAGHVSGNLAIIPELEKRGYEIGYIGSRDNIEKEIIPSAGIEYFEISSGMLRRYFDLKNFTDVFRVAKGTFDALKILRREKPGVIFSKGGFVTVPVAASAAMLNIPFICHESDLSPGLANKIASKFAKKVLVTFPETAEYFGDKGIHVGSPVREELLSGSKEKGLEYLGFTGEKPLLLAMGGSLGSPLLNRAIRQTLNELTKIYDICHHVGKGNLSEEYEGTEGYRQFEYISGELKDILAATSFVVSRAGSNSIFEFLALKIPNILIPLGLETSRGDQIENAESFLKSGYSLVLHEKEVTGESIMGKLKELKDREKEFKENMEASDAKETVHKVCNIIDDEYKA